MKVGYVYIMSNIKRTTFYTGVTSNLQKRVEQHKVSVGSEFTKNTNYFTWCILREYLE